jgi:NADH-ubiquinone oxidoreductase chain 5
MRYVNIFGFFLLFVSTGLTVCYSFCLIYFVICGDFNFVPSYSVVETSYNMVFGIIGSSVTRSPTGNVLGTTYHRLYCTV